MLLTASISVFVEIANLLVDKIVAGQMLGEQALSAIALITPLFSVVFFVGVVIAVGSIVCYTYEIGKINKERASCFFGQSIILAVIAGVVMSLALWLFQGPLFALLSVSQDLVALTGAFYKWFVVLALLLPLNNVLQEMIYVDGDTHVCNISCISLTVVNIVTSLILAKRMGMEGIAIGSVIGVAVSELILLTHFLKKTNTLKFKWHLKSRDCSLVVRLSLVEACDYLFFAAFSYMLTQFVLLNFGESHLSILSMMFEVWEFGVIFTGIWLAAEPLINIYRGEENAFCVKRLMGYVNWMVLKEGIFATAGLLLFAPLVVRLFHFSSADLIDDAVFAVRMAALGMLALSFVKVYASYYVHEWPICAVSLVTISALVVPGISCVGLGFVCGIDGVWVGFGVAPVLSFLVGILVLGLRYGWKNVPLNLSEKLENAHRYVSDMELNPKNIIDLRNHTERILIREKVRPEIRMKIMLFVEEMGMIFYERCKGRKIYAEHDMLFEKDCIVCTIKDEGPFLDLTDEDLFIGDLRMYLVNSMMVNHDDKTYLLTTRYNRHVFRFPR